jgi:glycosyltransferase involved in cell wall biosynthesis
MEQFMLPILYVRRAIQLKDRYDVCIINIPPLALSWFARFFKFLKGTPAILNVQDFHPQELVDVGIMGDGPFKTAMEWIERGTYKGADYMTVLSPGGVDYVVERGANPDKVCNVYNSFMNNGNGMGDQKFLAEMGIKEKHIISYAGILSPFQNVGCILDAMTSLKGDEVRAVIAGDGMERGKLACRIEQEGLENVTLIDYLPKDRYTGLLQRSDFCLVTLDDRMRAPCIPGKVVSIMSAGKAILAIVNPESETAKLVRSVDCGRVVDPKDKEGIATAIREMLATPQELARMGENARRFVADNMDLDKNVTKYEWIIASLQKSD